MVRLLVHVEGETEETFVNDVLRPHLFSHGYGLVSARIVGNSRLRLRRGGIRGWTSVRSDIVRHLTSDSAAFATTMVDYYALPSSGPAEWPGRKEAATAMAAEKGDLVETALARDILQVMGKSFDSRRFIPFVVIHEFEGLLFSDCEAFGRGVGKPDIAPFLQKIRNSFKNPEEINDSPLTAPSKRVQSLMPHYQKPLLGTLAILEIGLSRIRAECPHFAKWISHLESIPRLNK